MKLEYDVLSIKDVEYMKVTLLLHVIDQYLLMVYNKGVKRYIISDLTLPPINIRTRKGFATVRNQYVVGDELHYLPRGSRIYRKWTTNIYIMTQHLVAKP